MRAGREGDGGGGAGKGRLQIQSEGAEVYYRNIAFRAIRSFPARYNP